MIFSIGKNKIVPEVEYKNKVEQSIGKHNKYIYNLWTNIGYENGYIVGDINL